MTTAALPAIAHIQEAQLRIVNPVDAVRRVLNRKNPVPAHMREMWLGAVVFAPMSVANLNVLHAFFASLDGMTTPFKFNMNAGYLTQTSSITATVSGAHASGVKRVKLTGFSAGAEILAGTLLAIGSVDASTYQVCEVLEDTIVTSGGTQFVEIAPRIRNAIADTTAVSFGTVSGKFCLAQDDLSGAKVSLSYGVMTINVIEALQ